MPTGRSDVGAGVVDGEVHGFGGASSVVLDVLDVFSQNAPPTADAGVSQSIHAGEIVVLDGNGSFDDTSPSEDLVYAWTFDRVADTSSTPRRRRHRLAQLPAARRPGLPRPRPRRDGPRPASGESSALHRAHGFGMLHDLRQ